MPWHRIKVSSHPTDCAPNHSKALAYGVSAWELVRDLRRVASMLGRRRDRGGRLPRDLRRRGFRTDAASSGVPASAWATPKEGFGLREVHRGSLKDEALGCPTTRRKQRAPGRGLGLELSGR